MDKHMDKHADKQGISLESVDPAACRNLRSLIVGPNAPFATHCPEGRIRSWVAREIDGSEIDALLLKLAHQLVEKYQAEAAMAPKLRRSTRPSDAA
jgi:hypothetical protein